jgi:hypothetical protein
MLRFVNQHRAGTPVGQAVGRTALAKIATIVTGD